MRTRPLWLLTPSATSGGFHVALEATELDLELEWVIQWPFLLRIPSNADGALTLLDHCPERERVFWNLLIRALEGSAFSRKRIEFSFHHPCIVGPSVMLESCSVRLRFTSDGEWTR
jgi:hypothetical protein